MANSTHLLKGAASLTAIHSLPFDRSDEAVDGATVIVNASPLGMAHAGPMPDALLASLKRAAPEATAFDLVYDPPATPFLEAAAAAGLRTVDGVTMLIGQARTAFQLFYGATPPHDRDDELRVLVKRDLVRSLFLLSKKEPSLPRVL